MGNVPGEELVSYVSQVVTNIENFMVVNNQKVSLTDWNFVSSQLRTLVAKLSDFFQLLPNDGGPWTAGVKIESELLPVNVSAAASLRDRELELWINDEDLKFVDEPVREEAEEQEEEEEAEQDVVFDNNVPTGFAKFAPWPCLYCGDEFESKRLYSSHFQSCHVISESKEEDEEEMGLEQEQRVGAKMTAKRFRCVKCDSTFPRKTALRDHFGAIHEQKTFLCSLCGAEFKFRQRLQEHINSTHKRVSATSSDRIVH